MSTKCKQQSFEYHPLNRREVVGRFDGGAITTDGGGLLLREVEKRTGIIERFAGCFRDHRGGSGGAHGGGVGGTASLRAGVGL
jgi:Transposase DDE domain group 1